ncbi:2385_t:CDS:2 [Funneliformis mosseae]|uniref:2385_t:CDS:1 n=1 Tax=Funneliformis mosseae TaxID=27381 RepID=A0A9N9BC56_FUNMO|nr:2385_t:CDS:2 [Funneliformis mosseae]
MSPDDGQVPQQPRFEVILYKSKTNKFGVDYIKSPEMPKIIKMCKKHFTKHPVQANSNFI